jgi:hypothetical protein
MLEKHRKILEKLKEHGVTIYKFNDGPADPEAWEKIFGMYKLPFPVNAEKLLHGEELGIGDEHLKLRRNSS